MAAVINEGLDVCINNMQDLNFIYFPTNSRENSFKFGIATDTIELPQVCGKHGKNYTKLEEKSTSQGKYATHQVVNLSRMTFTKWYKVNI